MKWHIRILNAAAAFVQIAALAGVALAMDKLAGRLGLPLPGSILGAIAVFLLLKTKLLPLRWIERGANWLLAELLLFFVPSAVGIVQYPSLLGSAGFQLLLVIAAGTLLVLACAGAVTKLVLRPRARKEADCR
ncbi:CidA/LrgA family protein [Cohnella algarum]|uniref:CidA/LrgA family protein n=1 Tax=Cohnella algarum TaxID=2044859 RepID=UPI001966E287|nr:CidA/LrgA family holin-like protein [Cohnella algarum]MBN2980566.1 CidA/LrgA family holin-like protein [Cohnella algarum]